MATTTPLRLVSSAPLPPPPAEWNLRYRNADLSIFGGVVGVSEDDVRDGVDDSQAVELRVSFRVIRVILTPPPSSTPRWDGREAFVVFPLSQMHPLQDMVSYSVFTRPDAYVDFCFNFLRIFVVHQVRLFSSLHGRTPRTVIMQINVAMHVDEPAAAAAAAAAAAPPTRPAPVPQLEKVAYGAAEASGVSERACPICLTDFETGEEVGKTPCGHPFHPACLGKSLEKNPLCPICRKRIPLVSDSDHAPPAH